MKLPISQRLLACAAFVLPGERIADIGCDHGYLSIHLLTNGIARSCIASDVRPQPLQSAVQNAEKFGVREKMEFYLSDGVQSIPRDFDCMVCAGMGGDTIVSILNSAPWLRSDAYRLILQCQSKTPMLRKFLSQQGWRIDKETVLRDGKFLYTVMQVQFDPGQAFLTDAQCYFPPVLLLDATDAVAEYYRWVLGGLEIAAAHRDDGKEILAELRSLPQNYPCLEE